MLDACEAEGASLPRPTSSPVIVPSAPGCRVQRSRRKGAGVPDGAVNICRGTLWANPFAGRQWRHAKSVILHERWLTGRLGALSLEKLGFSSAEIDALDRWRCRLLTRLHVLAGQTLACFCPVTSKWCHGNIYLRLAPIHAEYERFAI